MMKNAQKLFGLMLFASLMFTSCSKDDDGNSGGSGLDGVPSGEIVSVEERDEALTGYSDPEGGVGTQKWWTHVISSIDFSSEECGDDETHEELGYYAWYPDGYYYYKASLDDTPTVAGTWEWTNEDKTKVYIYNQSTGLEAEMTLTYLNESNIVYGSYQTQGDCSATVYEQFSDPF